MFDLWLTVLHGTVTKAWHCILQRPDSACMCYYHTSLFCWGFVAAATISITTGPQENDLNTNTGWILTRLARKMSKKMKMCWTMRTRFCYDGSLISTTELNHRHLVHLPTTHHLHSFLICLCLLQLKHICVYLAKYIWEKML